MYVTTISQTNGGVFMTEEQRSMVYGIDTFMKRLEFSFRNEKDILKRLKDICDQAYYDIAFDEFHPQDNNHFNIFNIRTTEDEKQELSDKLYEFHDAYENSFADYFDESEELEDFMSCYKGLYDLIDTLMDRW